MLFIVFCYWSSRNIISFLLCCFVGTTKKTIQLWLIDWLTAILKICRVGGEEEGRQHSSLGDAVVMQHTFYFYLSIFVRKKRYFYSVTVRYILLITCIFIHLLFSTQLFDLFCQWVHQRLCHMTLLRQSNVATNNGWLCFTNQIEPGSHMTTHKISAASTEAKWLKTENIRGNNGVLFRIRIGRTPLATHTVYVHLTAHKNRTAMSCAVICVCLNMLTFQPTRTPFRTSENTQVVYLFGCG